MKISDVTKKIRNLGTEIVMNMDEKKPTILMYGGVLGVVTVGVTGINGAIKAKEIYDAADGKVDKTVAINMAKCFIPFGIATVGTILCVVGVHKEYVAKAAALAAVHAADTLGDNTVGNKVIAPATKINNNLVNEAVTPSANSGVKPRIYDEYAGRFIDARIIDIQAAAEAVNDDFIASDCDYAMASTFYETLTDGYYVPDCVNGKVFYKHDGALKIEYDSQIGEDGLPFLTFKFNREPQSSFE